jgi:predicted nucleic acid-binding protein
MNSGPYLFDVSLIALAHAGTPVSEPALRYVRQAVEGEIDAVIPHPALIGTQHILRRVYRFSNTEAARLMTQFRDARRIHWYEDIPEPLLCDGLTLADTANINGWDGYYATVARNEGVKTILTLDDDFERVEGVTCEVVLDTEQFETLNEYIDRL